MTLTPAVQLKRLEDNISQLLQLCKRLGEENNKLSEQLIKREEGIKELEKDKEQIKTKYSNLKMANGMANSASESAEAKQKINKLVREIDKCISLLDEQ